MDSLVNFSPLVVVAWKRGAGSRGVLAARRLVARTSVATSSGTLEGRYRVRMPGMYHKLSLIWLRGGVGIHPAGERKRRPTLRLPAAGRQKARRMGHPAAGDFRLPGVLRGLRAF